MDGRRVLALTLAALVSGCLAPAPQPPREIPCLNRDDHGLFLVLDDPAALDAFWGRHCGAAEPAVDFTNSMVVVRLLGLEFGKGYAAQLTGITADAGGTTYEYAYSWPGHTCSYDRAIDHPESVWVVDRASGPFAFDDRSVPDDCS